MEREELINKGADAVRNTPLLFNEYKRFLLEDWGELPQGCFGCQFSNHFNQWKNQVLNNNIKPMEKTVNNLKSYILKDKSTLKYFKGDVWSNNSTDEDWIRYIGYKPDAKELFYVLPSALEKTDSDLVVEEDYKKKEISNEPTIEDVVDENIQNEDTTIVEDTKPRRGRKK